MSTIRSPRVSPSSSVRPKRASMAAAVSSSPVLLRFGTGLRPRSSGALTVAVSVSGYPRGLGRGLLLSRSNSHRSVFSFAASHEESKPSEIEVEEEASRLKEKVNESEEAWQQALATFKEQAFKMKSISGEAFEEYSKKAMVTLKETSEQLKIRAEKVREDLAVIAKELGEDGKVYLSTAAENYPEPVKDIVETFASSTDDLKDVSEVRDFYVGIPYGALLSFGGFLSFMITGSISAIRFGVILGGTLLALSVYSLRSWKKGENSSVATKAQAAIVTTLFLREVRLLFSRGAFANYISVLISGAVLAFYVYRISSGQAEGGSSIETGTEN